MISHIYQFIDLLSEHSPRNGLFEFSLKTAMCERSDQYVRKKKT